MTTVSTKSIGLYVQLAGAGALMAGWCSACITMRLGFVLLRGRPRFLLGRR